MVADEWLRELADLRRGGGDRRRYRARVYEVRRGAWEVSLPLMLWRAAARSGWERDWVSVLLYEESAAPGDLPIVVVPVQVDAPVERIRRGDVVQARGIAEAGRAMVIDLDGEAIFCAGPAFVPSLLRWPYRL